MEFHDFWDFPIVIPIDLDTPGASCHFKQIIYKKLRVYYIEEVSQKKIPIPYNIFFCDTSSTSVAK